MVEMDIAIDQVDGQDDSDHVKSSSSESAKDMAESVKGKPESTDALA